MKINRCPSYCSTIEITCFDRNSTGKNNNDENKHIDKKKLIVILFYSLNPVKVNTNPYVVTHSLFHLKKIYL